VVAVEAGQVERTRRKDLVTGSTRVFVPDGPSRVAWMRPSSAGGSAVQADGQGPRMSSATPPRINLVRRRGPGMLGGTVSGYWKELWMRWNRRCRVVLVFLSRLARARRLQRERRAFLWPRAFLNYYRPQAVPTHHRHSHTRSLPSAS
jgi:hypothetical protein